MANITRLGAYGGARPLYGDFSGKAEATIITPTGIASAEAFGTAVITTGVVYIVPTGIAGAEAFGTAVITGGDTTTATTNKFGKTFYADQDKKKRKALTLQMRQEDEEILALVQIIGRLVL